MKIILIIQIPWIIQQLIPPSLHLKLLQKTLQVKVVVFHQIQLMEKKITGIYPSYDEDYERIATATNKYYRNKKTGVIYKRHLDDDGVYRYY